MNYCLYSEKIIRVPSEICDFLPHSLNEVVEWLKEVSLEDLLN